MKTAACWVLFLLVVVFAIWLCNFLPDWLNALSDPFGYFGPRLLGSAWAFITGGVVLIAMIIALLWPRQPGPPPTKPNGAE